MLEADAERSELLAAERRLAAAEQADTAALERVHARLQEIEAEQAPARAAKILHGLGFDLVSQPRRAKSLMYSKLAPVSYPGLKRLTPLLISLRRASSCCMVAWISS